MTTEELDLRADDALVGFCDEAELHEHCKAFVAEVRRLREQADTVGYHVGEAMKRIENSNPNAAYQALQSAQEALGE